MDDYLIDAEQVELYLEELRHNPADRDPRLDELVELYMFQTRLATRDDMEALYEIYVARERLIEQWNKEN